LPYCGQLLQSLTHIDFAVVVEKPFTCTSAEADEVIQAATRKGVILTVYQSESDVYVSDIGSIAREWNWAHLC
jgi:hypothetical protein